MKIGMMTVIVDVIRKRESNNMWDKYIPDTNESIVPETFRASDDAMYHHNNEVFNLESRINVLEFENDKLRKALKAGLNALELAIKHNYKGGWCALEERVTQGKNIIEQALKENV